MLTTTLLSLATGSALPIAISDPRAHEDDLPRFASPRVVLADGEPVNGVEKQPYPSPVLFDIDRDGQDELIYGDLWGFLWVHENQAESGEAVWGKAAKLESDGEPIEVSNW